MVDAVKSPEKWNLVRQHMPVIERQIELDAAGCNVDGRRKTKLWKDPEAT